MIVLRPFEAAYRAFLVELGRAAVEQPARGWARRKEQVEMKRARGGAARPPHPAGARSVSVVGFVEKLHTLVLTKALVESA